MRKPLAALRGRKAASGFRVPWAGLEPALPFGNTPLKRVCLPFHHHGESFGDSYIIETDPARIKPPRAAVPRAPRPGPVRGASRTPRHARARPPAAPRAHRPAGRTAPPGAAPPFRATDTAPRAAGR